MLPELVYRDASRGYQLYRQIQTDGFGLLRAAGLDEIIVGFTWREYGPMRRHLAVD